MILNAGEARIVLGLAASITDADRGLLEMLLPMVNGAIIKELGYDPEYKTHTGEFYPRAEVARREGGGTWDSNGTVAYFQPYDRGLVLQLHHLPVRSVTEVKVDYNGGFGSKANTFGADTIKVEGTDFYQDLMQSGFNATGHLFSNTGWPSEPGSVKVTYKAGYTRWELSGQADNPDQADPDTELAPIGIDASAIKEAALIALVNSFTAFKMRASAISADGTVSGVLSGERMGDYSYTLDLSALKMAASMSVSIPPDAAAKLEPFRHWGLMLL